MAREELALIEAEELKPEVITLEKGLNDLLERVKVKVKSFVYDATTDQGRADIKSLAYQISLSKKPLDNVLVKESEEASQKVKRINKLRNTATAFLDNLRDETRKPVTLYEAEQEVIRQSKIKAEEERVAGIRAMIATISNHGVTEYGETSEALKQRLILVENMLVDEKYAEFQAEADATKRGVLAQLNKVLSERLEFERQQAEQKAEAERLKKIRKEQEEAQRKLDEENKRKEDARKAEEVKLQSERDAIETEKKKMRDDKLKVRKSQLKPDPDENEMFPDDEEIMCKTDDEFLEFKNDWNSTIDKIKADREAKVKADAEKAAREKLEREQREKVIKEEAEKKRLAKIEARKPDRQKLMDYAGSITTISRECYPSIKDEDAQHVLEMFKTSLESVISTFLKQVEDL